MTGSNSVPKNLVAAQDIGQATYLISLIDGRLTEYAHGESLTNPISIGSAKPDSDATYLDTGDKRHVICLNEKNQLQDYEYDADEGEWIAGKLHDLKLTAHPKTTISTTYGKNAGHVYFQTPAGKIQEVVLHADGKWKPSAASSPYQPDFGARLASAILQETAHVFYTHPDHSIHKIVVQGDEWKDSLVEGTNDGLVKISIAAGAGDNGFALKYINSQQECFVYHGGATTKVGHITQDGFSPISNAQAANVTPPPIPSGGVGGVSNSNSQSKVSVGVGLTGDLASIKVPTKTIGFNGAGQGANIANWNFNIMF